jgi:hypothetical protein
MTRKLLSTYALGKSSPKETYISVVFGALSINNQNQRQVSYSSANLRTDESCHVEHQPGVAVIHLGKHRHAATPITGGHRINLIVWARSSEFREKDLNEYECPKWCNKK